MPPTCTYRKRIFARIRKKYARIGLLMDGGLLLDEIARNVKAKCEDEGRENRDGLWTGTGAA
jgi:hypothetical protein